MADHAQRLAFMLLPGLDHFTPGLLASLPCPGLEVRAFYVRGLSDLAAACEWADILWFEFCWPPFPEMIARFDFGGRRVMMRVHRIEAYGTRHAATAPWPKIDDVIVVSADMATRLLAEAPALEQTTRLHVVHNGVDTERFRPAFGTSGNPEPFRIGWCGWLSLHKNPIMALEILAVLRRDDPRWRMHFCAKGGDIVVMDSFNHLKHRLRLEDAVVFDGNVAPGDMPAWHAANTVLLSTSIYESFGYAMAEAASCGCDVVMLDQTGAAEFWPPEMRFGSSVEAASLIRGTRPMRWRSLIEHDFSLKVQVAKLRGILHVGEDAEMQRIGVHDEVLDILAAPPAALRLDTRPAEEMDAADYLLRSMGYQRGGRCAGGIQYRLG